MFPVNQLSKQKFYHSTTQLSWCCWAWPSSASACSNFFVDRQTHPHTHIQWSVDVTCCNLLTRIDKKSIFRLSKSLLICHSLFMHACIIHGMHRASYASCTVSIMHLLHNASYALCILCFMHHMHHASYVSCILCIMHPMHHALHYYL